VTDCLRKKGMRSMAQDGLEKAAMGVTCMDELRRVCSFGQGIEVMRRRPNSLLLDLPIGADCDSSYHEGERRLPRVSPNPDDKGFPLGM